MEEKLVSIITPMYNAKAFIAETMESVLAQTYPYWEMIIVDDVSTDSCAEIVKAYAMKDSRIKYYKHQKNSGVAVARNTAIQKASGRYIAFLDSDDLWKANKLEKQLQFMKEKQVTFCYSDCEIINETGESTGKIRHVPEMQDYKKLLKGNAIPCLTVLIDRSRVSKIEMPLIPHEDYAAWLSILKTGIVAYGQNEVLAKYRVNSTSLSGNKVQAAIWTWNIYRKQEKLGIIKSIYCFICYMLAAIKKRA